MNDFITGYLAAALWSSNDDDDDPLENNFNFEDFHPEVMERIKVDCTKFQEENKELLDQYKEITNRPLDYAGHDFWLTRNGHGTGFWDRGAGEVGDKLTEACKAYGSVYIYVIAGKLFVDLD